MFLENVKNLAIRDVNKFHMRIPEEFLLVESESGEFPPPFIFINFFESSAPTPQHRAWQGEVEAERRRVGSTITTRDLVTRAELQTCVGCHFIGGRIGDGIVFPSAAFEGQHVTEDLTGPAGTRFVISPAMRDVFIPNRMRILRDFIVSGKRRSGRTSYFAYPVNNITASTAPST